MGMEKGTETRRIWGEHFPNVLLLGGNRFIPYIKVGQKCQKSSTSVTQNITRVSAQSAECFKHKYKDR